VARKGELSKSTIDREFPHQVALPASDVVGAGYRPRHDFANSRGACLRGHTFRRDDRDFVVFCFLTREAADAFMERFGGEYMTPETRPLRLPKR
jgi:hypothetical protein